MPFAPSTGRMRLRTGGLILALLFIGGLASARAAAPPQGPGDLDPTFGSGGNVTTAFPVTTTARANAVVLLANGQYVTAGTARHAYSDNDFLVSRFTANGSLDPTFGQGGQATTDFTGWDDVASALAVQADGKIVAAGYNSQGPNSSAFGLVRYNPDGTLDSAFGTGGRVSTAFSYSSEVAGLVIQPDGKILAVGSGAPQGQTTQGFALARYLPNGSLDPAFGTGGQVVTLFGTQAAAATAVGLQADGRIVVAGGTNGNFALARYLADGSLDASFGTGGQVSTDFGGANDTARTLALQADGKIIVAGNAGTASNPAFALARYLANGTLDPAFGAGGLVTTAFGTTPSQAAAVRVQPDGKIVVAGAAANYCSSSPCVGEFALARYLGNGSLDPAFGTGGQVTTSVDANGFAVAGGLVLQANGTLVVAGTASASTQQYNIVLARYLSTGILDQAFGSGGLASAGATTSDGAAHAVALQTDGKIIAVGSVSTYCTPSCIPGDFVLVRYLANGSLDPTFGTGGTVITHFSRGTAEAYGVAIQPDGKIVADGYAGNGTDGAFAVARYLPNGSLDSSFGTGGMVITDVDDTFRDSAFTVALQADGKILAAGYTPYGGLAVVRYLPNGSLDTGFGAGGIVLTPIDHETAYAFSLAVQPDGNILAGGATSQVCSVTCTNENFALVRYLTDGQLDPAFGTGGVVTTSLGTASDDRIYGLALQPDGKILAAGPAGVNCDGSCRSSDFGLARYQANGALDPTFGSGGIVTTDFTGNYDAPAGLVLQPDGGIVLGGQTQALQYGFSSFGLARYLSNGALDPSFGNAGTVATSFGGGSSIGNAVALAPDGKIILAGQAFFGGDGVIALARYGGGSGPPRTPLPTPTASQVLPSPTQAPTTGPTTTATPIPSSPTPCTAGQFSDVHPTDYFYTPVQYLVSHAVVSGYGDCTFRPYNQTTRGQMVKIVVTGFQLPISTPAGGPTFADVPVTFPFYLYVETAAAHQLVSGYACSGPGEPCDAQSRPYFRPYADVTRGQLSKITVAAAGWSLLNPASATFADVPPGSPFYPFAATASCHGIISGYTCGGPGEPCDGQQRPYFRPNGNATRGQIAKIAYLAISGTSVCATPVAMVAPPP